MLTAEVNAAVQGAYDAGASDVLVIDAHGDMQNIDPAAGRFRGMAS